MTTLNEVSQTEKVEYRTISRVGDVNVRATKERDKPKLRHRRRAAVTRGAGGHAGRRGQTGGARRPAWAADTRCDVWVNGQCTAHLAPI